MKAKLLPVQIRETNAQEQEAFAAQLRRLGEMYGDQSELLPVQMLDSLDTAGADAVLFPQLVGAVFGHERDLAGLTVPVLVLTSGFGTVEMWDWEIVAYLRERLGLQVLSPYNEEMARVIMRALAARRDMRAGAKFLMFQDTPGDGMQANIFKRFYWWEQEATRQIEQAFGVRIVYRSWKGVNEAAQQIPDDEAAALWRQREVPTEGLPLRDILQAVKVYMAVRRVMDEVGDVVGVGSNCLNESFHSLTTPCLAWDWLYEHDHVIWACEGDTVTLISKYLFYSALRRPMMMTNIYPFLMGMAALKHEKIEEFPQVEDPDRHALGVHCGYFGLAPRSFCTQWMLRPRVLEIVNPNAVVIDCRMKEGPVTLAKLHADMKKLTVVRAVIEGYVQYEGSDCRNGALLRYTHDSGHGVMESLSSHHQIIIQGEVAPLLTQVARVYGFEVELL